MLYGRARNGIGRELAWPFNEENAFAVDVEIEDLLIVGREQYGADGK